LLANSGENPEPSTLVLNIAAYDDQQILNAMQRAARKGGGESHSSLTQWLMEAGCCFLFKHL
jgi:hypothetical protein